MTRSHPDKSSRHTYKADGNDIRPHTVQAHNECTSKKFSLVSAYSTVHGPPEDGRKYVPKHVGATSLKVFFYAFKCFKYSCELVF
jgi:hypothetical protein